MLGYFFCHITVIPFSNVVTILRAGLHPFLQMAIPSHRKGVAIRSKRCSLVKCVLRMLLAGIIAACIESVFLCPRLVFILLHPKKKRKRKNLRWQITLPRQYNISYPTIKNPCPKTNAPSVVFRMAFAQSTWYNWLISMQ